MASNNLLGRGKNTVEILSRILDNMDTKHALENEMSRNKCQLNMIKVITRKEISLIHIAEVKSLSIMLGPTCNIQEITNGHMILDKAANKLIQNFICCYSIDKPLTEKTTINKEHRREEEVPT